MMPEHCVREFLKEVREQRRHALALGGSPGLLAALRQVESELGRELPPINATLRVTLEPTVRTS